MSINSLIFAVAVGLGLLTWIDLVRAARQGREVSETTANRVARFVGVIGILNFCAFMAVAVLLGGDALNGRTGAGHYFLGSHGSYTEVSHAVFIYSAVHAYSAIAGMCATFYISKIWRKQDQRNESQDH